MAKDYKIEAVINAKDNASPKFEKFSIGVSKWLKRAELAAIAAAIAFGTMSMKWGMDFESQMSSLEAVSRATSGEMAALTEKAKQLGRDSAYSATESGKAMEFLAMAGLKPGEVLASVGDTLNLAAAGSLDLANAADIASNVLTGFNLKAEEMGRVADVMAETAASANTSVYQLGEAMSYVAPQAAAAGWSLEETAAAIGMLGNAGIQGSMAGTVLRQAIVQLLDPSDKAWQAMKNLDMSITDSNGQMLSLEGILRQIDPAILDTADGLGELTKIFGTRATPGIISLIKQGTDNLGGFKEQLEASAGAAERMARTKLDNLSGAFTLLKSSLEGIGIALVTGGENSLTGGIQTFIEDSLIPMINKTTEWIDQIGGLPGMFSLASDIIVTFAGDVKTALVNLFTDWDTFKEFAGSFGSALIVSVMLLSKFVLEIVGGIAKMATVVWLPLVAPLSVVISQIKELFQLFINWIGPKFIDTANALIKPFRWVFAQLGIEIGELEWTRITVDPAMKMEDAWKASGQIIKDTGVEVVDRLKGEFNQLTTGITLAGGIMKDSVIAVNPELGKFREKVNGLVKEHGALGKAAKAAGDAAKAIPEALHKVPDNADDAAKELGIGSRIWEAIGSLGKYTSKSLNAGWEKYIKDLNQVHLNQVEDAIYHMALTIEQEMGKSFYEFFRKGQFTFKAGWRVIKDMSQQALADMFATEVMRTVVKRAVDWMVDLFTGDEDGDRGFAKIKKTAENLWDDFGWTYDVVKTGVSGALKYLLQIFDLHGWDKIQAAAKGLWIGFGWTKELIYSALQQAISWFIGLFDGSATSAFARILSAAQSLWGSLSSIFSQQTILVNYSYNQIGGGIPEVPNMPSGPDTGTHIPGPEPTGFVGTFLDWIGLGPKYEGPNIPKKGEDMWRFLWASGRVGHKDDIWKLYNQFSDFQQRYWQGTDHTPLPAHFALMSYEDQLIEWLKEDKGINVYKHSGGLLSDEGLFIGLRGEGVLNRNAMGMLGEGGLQNLNQGKAVGNVTHITIQAMDGSDVRRVFENEIIPLMRESSEAGVNVIHENGIQHDVAV